MRRISISALFSLSALFLCACSTIPAHAKESVVAKPAWKWKGFEIIGNHKVLSRDIQAVIPIHLGDTFREDVPTWQTWCTDIKSKFALPFTNCSAVRYSNFDAYFVVDVVEPGFEYRNRFRAAPAGDIPFATQDILKLYERLYQRLWELFDEGTPPSETSDKGYLDYSDAEMHGLVQKLIQIVPGYRANLLDVVENDKDINKREKAANLLNWTLNDLDKSILQANRLLDDPSTLVRNNISRFTPHFLDKVQNQSARKLIIDQLLLQLDRPTFADRNKAIFNLLLIAQKFPQDRPHIKSKGGTLIKYISTVSVLDNVKGIAIEVLKMLESAPIHNYVFFGRDRERISEKGFIKTPKFEGAQLMYAWKELESGEDNYDFSEMQKDLDFLKANGKRLFVQLQDTTFDPSTAAVPNYLRQNAKYHGGVVYQYKQNGQPDGLVLMRWDPAVRERLHKLLKVLGKTFDGKIAGITLQETAIDVATGAKSPRGFTPLRYRDAILSNMKVLKESFPKSLAMQYANFMPGDDDISYLRSVFDFAKRIGMGIGAPDLMPNNVNQKSHAYKLMHELNSSIPVGIAVQNGNYGGTTGDDIKPTEPWPNIVPDLYGYAASYLNVNYIFWGAQEPYFSHDVVPYFEGKKEGYTGDRS
jgi:hypothetical protein